MNNCFYDFESYDFKIILYALEIINEPKKIIVHDGGCAVARSRGCARSAKFYWEFRRYFFNGRLLCLSWLLLMRSFKVILGFEAFRRTDPLQRIQ